MSNSVYYILDEQGNHLPVTLDMHDEWYETHDRATLVGQWAYGLNPATGGFQVEVCTHFHGVPLHSDDAGLPLLYSTIVLGGMLDDKEWHYTSWEDARLGHTACVYVVKGLLGLNTGPTALDDVTIPSPASRDARRSRCRTPPSGDL